MTATIAGQIAVVREQLASLPGGLVRHVERVVAFESAVRAAERARLRGLVEGMRITGWFFRLRRGEFFSRDEILTLLDGDSK